MIELREVTKVYEAARRAVPSVRGVSVRIAPGEFVVIMGPSGSGKSTLLRLMGVLDTPTSGQVLFQQIDVAALSDHDRSLFRLKRIGFVFQSFNLLATLTAAENVGLPLQLAGSSRRASRRAAMDLLKRLRLEDRADHFPDELSGGEMQRIAIARALVSEPEVVLCDEPTGSLDSVSGREVVDLLRSLPKPGGRSVVMVTHDPEAALVGDRVLHIRDGMIESEVASRGACAVAASNA
jgi:putative ABC transport system ATP-binding protein